MALIDKNARQAKTHLNLRAFKTKKELMTNVEITETKKKEEKEDPRLKNRAKKAAIDPFKPVMKWYDVLWLFLTFNEYWDIFFHLDHA